MKIKILRAEMLIMSRDFNTLTLMNNSMFRAAKASDSKLL